MDGPHATITVYAGRRRLRRVAWTAGPLLRIGRHRANDLALGDLFVSRFHASLLWYAGAAFLLDHSYNGTLVTEPGPDGVERTTHLGNVMDSDVFRAYRDRHDHDTAEHPSVVLARAEQADPKIASIAGYEAHAFRRPDDVAYLRRMARDPEQVAILASQGRRLAPGAWFAIRSQEHDQFRLLYHPGGSDPSGDPHDATPWEASGMAARTPAELFAPDRPVTRDDDGGDDGDDGEAGEAGEAGPKGDDAGDGADAGGWGEAGEGLRDQREDHRSKGWGEGDGFGDGRGDERDTLDGEARID